MNTRVFLAADTQAVMALWQMCGLVQPHNNPGRDIERKLNQQGELFFVGEQDGEIIASAMFGYEGHRGWVNYLAVAPTHQKQGHAQAMMQRGESELVALGCPKLNLQVRKSNLAATKFYQASGYVEDDAVSFGKRLIKDTN